MTSPVLSRPGASSRWSWPFVTESRSAEVFGARGSESATAVSDRPSAGGEDAEEVPSLRSNPQSFGFVHGCPRNESRRACSFTPRTDRTQAWRPRCSRCPKSPSGWASAVRRSTNCSPPANFAPCVSRARAAFGPLTSTTSSPVSTSPGPGRLTHTGPSCRRPDAADARVDLMSHEEIANVAADTRLSRYGITAETVLGGQQRSSRPASPSNAGNREPGPRGPARHRTVRGEGEGIADGHEPTLQAAPVGHRHPHVGIRQPYPGRA